MNYFLDQNIILKGFKKEGRYKENVKIIYEFGEDLIKFILLRLNCHKKV